MPRGRGQPVHGLGRHAERVPVELRNAREHDAVAPQDVSLRTHDAHGGHAADGPRVKRSRADAHRVLERLRQTPRLRRKMQRKACHHAVFIKVPAQLGRAHERMSGHPVRAPHADAVSRRHSLPLVRMRGHPARGLGRHVAHALDAHASGSGGEPALGILAEIRILPLVERRQTLEHAQKIAKRIVARPDGIAPEEPLHVLRHALAHPEQIVRGKPRLENDAKRLGMEEAARLRSHAHEHLELRHADHVVEGKRILQLEVYAVLLAILVAREHLAAHPDGDGSPRRKARNLKRHGHTRLHGGLPRPVSDQGLSLMKRQRHGGRALGADREHERSRLHARTCIFSSHGHLRQKKR